MSQAKRTTWSTTDWPSHESHVQRYQRRIFKAAHLGNTRKVRYLQQRLIRSYPAKLIAVHTVTTDTQWRPPGMGKLVKTTDVEWFRMAKSLRLNGAAVTRRLASPSRGRGEKPLGLPILQDLAKQALAKLALEPEWEAYFEPNVYGFRPGRTCQDAVEAIFSNLHHGIDKLVYIDAPWKRFGNVDTIALIDKLGTFPLMARQIKAWLRAGVLQDTRPGVPPRTYGVNAHHLRGTSRNGVVGVRPDGVVGRIPNDSGDGVVRVGTIIGPLLANIALHGLETHLKTYVGGRNFPKPHPGSGRGRKPKEVALGITTYEGDLVITHRNPEIMTAVLDEARTWLARIGLQPDASCKMIPRWTSQSFVFSGFNVITVRRHDRIRVVIRPSRATVAYLVRDLHDVITRNRSVSAYTLIEKLRPRLVTWANYYRYCECSGTFHRVDNVVYQQLRAWTLRRANRVGRRVTMQKYFPSAVIRYNGVLHRVNWAFSGRQKVRGALRPRTVYLPKLAWTQSESWAKVRGKASVYDGDSAYWFRRNSRFISLSPNVVRLFNRQGGRCPWCGRTITAGIPLEVDHVEPLSHGGSRRESNLQLLHRACHIQKSRRDRLQEPDEGKSFTSGSEDESSRKRVGLV